MTIKQNLWLPDPSRLQSFLEADDEQAKWYCVTAVDATTNMRDCGWVQVGTAELHTTFHDDGLKEKAISSVDIAIAELTKTFQSKLEVLEGFKQTLLCLEAPKFKDARDAL